MNSSLQNIHRELKSLNLREAERIGKLLMKQATLPIETQELPFFSKIAKIILLIKDLDPNERFEKNFLLPVVKKNLYGLTKMEIVNVLATLIASYRSNYMTKRLDSLPTKYYDQYAELMSIADALFTFFQSISEKISPSRLPDRTYSNIQEVITRISHLFGILKSPSKNTFRGVVCEDLFQVRNTLKQQLAEIVYTLEKTVSFEEVEFEEVKQEYENKKKSLEKQIAEIDKQIDQKEQKIKEEYIKEFESALRDLNLLQQEVYEKKGVNKRLPIIKTLVKKIESKFNKPMEDNPFAQMLFVEQRSRSNNIGTREMRERISGELKNDQRFREVVSNASNIKEEAEYNIKKGEQESKVLGTLTKRVLDQYESIANHNILAIRKEIQYVLKQEAKKKKVSINLDIVKEEKDLSLLEIKKIISPIVEKLRLSTDSSSYISYLLKFIATWQEPLDKNAIIRSDFDEVKRAFDLLKMKFEWLDNNKVFSKGKFANNRRDMLLYKKGEDPEEDLGELLDSDEEDSFAEQGMSQEEIDIDTLPLMKTVQVDEEPYLHKKVKTKSINSVADVVMLRNRLKNITIKSPKGIEELEQIKQDLETNGKFYLEEFRQSVNNFDSNVDELDSTLQSKEAKSFNKERRYRINRTAWEKEKTIHFDSKLGTIKVLFYTLSNQTKQENVLDLQQTLPFFKQIFELSKKAYSIRGLTKLGKQQTYKRLHSFVQKFREKISILQDRAEQIIESVEQNRSDIINIFLERIRSNKEKDLDKEQINVYVKEEEGLIEDFLNAVEQINNALYSYEEILYNAEKTLKAAKKPQMSTWLERLVTKKDKDEIQRERRERIRNLKRERVPKEIENKYKDIVQDIAKKYKELEEDEQKDYLKEVQYVLNEKGYDLSEMLEISKAAARSKMLKRGQLIEPFAIMRRAIFDLVRDLRTILEEYLLESHKLASELLEEWSDQKGREFHSKALVTFFGPKGAGNGALERGLESLIEIVDFNIVIVDEIVRKEIEQEEVKEIEKDIQKELESESTQQILKLQKLKRDINQTNLISEKAKLIKEFLDSFELKEKLGKHYRALTRLGQTIQWSTSIERVIEEFLDLLDRVPNEEWQKQMQQFKNEYYKQLEWYSEPENTSSKES